MTGRDRLQRITGRAPFYILLLVLLLAWLGAAAQMLVSDGRNERVDAVVQDCLGIISSAQKWYRSSSVVGGADRSSWEQLSFNRLGYDENVLPDGRTLINRNARYTIRVPENGSSFDLIAEGRDGLLVIYRGISNEPPPQPEIH
ncbi:hypothetical protein GF324_10445 [bacterium]|nr:hypothetical protein [bacterium]